MASRTSVTHHTLPARGTPKANTPMQFTSAKTTAAMNTVRSVAPIRRSSLNHHNASGKTSAPCTARESESPEVNAAPGPRRIANGSKESAATPK
jgi:hypothetical protein